jgi:Apg6 BARA domain
VSTFLTSLFQLNPFEKELTMKVRIVKDKIGDVSVKLQFNQEESWTRSLRHVLLALKICLKWATNGANG